MNNTHTRLRLAFGFITVMTLAGTSGTLRAQTADDGPIHVCADANGVLRLTEMKASCSTTQKSLFLERADPNFEDLSDKTDPKKPSKPNEQPPAKPANADTSPTSTPPLSPADAARLDDLERRVTTLENAPASKPSAVPNKVAAPFEVVDRSGRTILRVETDYFRLYHAGKEQAQLSVGENVASMVLGSELKTMLYSFGDQAGMSISNKNNERIALGSGDAGNFRLLFLAPDGKTQIAGIGQSAAGTGAVRIASPDGALKATMQVGDDGKAAVSVVNDGGIPLASLKEGANGGGLLEITSESGEPMVHAGVHPDGFGVVQAGPASFLTGAGLGLPGSYIQGKN